MLTYKDLNKEEKFDKELVLKSHKECNKCGELKIGSEYGARKTSVGNYNLRSSCKCCQKMADKQYYKENVEKRKEYLKENAEKIKEYRKEYYKENAEKIKEYYKENAEKIAERKKEYRKENAEYFKEYYKENAEKIKEYNKENAEKRKERKKKWDKENAEKIKEYNKENAEKIKERMKEYLQTPAGKEASARRAHKRRALKAKNGGSYTSEQWKICLEYFDNRCAYTGEVLDSLEIEHILALSKGGTSYIWNLCPSNKAPNRSKNNKDLETWYRKQEYFSEERLEKIYKWQEFAKQEYEIQEVA